MNKAKQFTEITERYKGAYQSMKDPMSATSTQKIIITARYVVKAYESSENPEWTEVFIYGANSPITIIEKPATFSQWLND